MANEIEPIEVTAKLDVSQIEQGIVQAIALIKNVGSQTAAQSKQAADQIKSAFDQVGRAADAIPGATAKAAASIQNLGKSGEAAGTVTDRMKKLSEVDFSKANREIDKLQDNIRKTGTQAEVAAKKTLTLQQAFERASGDLLRISAAMTGFLAIGVSAGSKVGDAFSILQRQTGATGAQLDGLKESFRTVAKGADEPLQSVADAVAAVNVRLGLTGDALESTSSAILNFAQVNRVEAAPAVELVSQLSRTYGIETAKIPGLLDKLTVAQQRTGIDAQELAANMIKARASLDALGLGLDESIALFASFEQAGIKPQEVITGLDNALRVMAERGEQDGARALQSIVDKVKAVKDPLEAATIASQLFGQRVGPKLAKDIRDGRLETNELVKALQDSEGALESAANGSATFSEKLGNFRNRMDLAAATVGDKLIPILENLGDIVIKLAEWFEDLNPYVQYAAIAITGLGGAVTGALLVLGQLAISITNITGLWTAYTGSAGTAALATDGVAVSAGSATVAIGLMAAEVVAVTAALIAAYQAFNFFRASMDELDARAKGAEAVAVQTSRAEASSRQLDRALQSLGRTRADVNKLTNAEIRSLSQAGVTSRDVATLISGLNLNIGELGAAGVTAARGGLEQLGIGLARVENRTVDFGQSTRRAAEAVGTGRNGRGGGGLHGAASGAAARIKELEQRLQKAKEAADEMQQSVRKLNDLLRESRQATNPGTGVVAEIAGIQEDIEARRRKAEEARAAAISAGAQAQAGGNAAIIQQVETQTAELNSTFAALDEQLGAEQAARIQREADERIAAIRDRTDQILEAERVESERLAIEQGRLVGNEFEARRVAAQAAGNREIERIKAEFANRKEQIDREIAGLENELAGLKGKEKDVRSSGIGYGPKGPILNDEQLAQLRSIEAESTRVRDILTRLQAERQAAVDANVALITAKERALQDQLAQIRAEGFQRETQESQRRSKETIDQQVAFAVRQKEAQIAAAAGDEVAVARIQAEIATLQENAAKEKVKIDQWALDRVRTFQTTVLHDERRLADFRIQLSHEVADREAEVENAKLARVKAMIALTAAEREKAARDDEARLERDRTNAETDRSAREQARGEARQSVGRLGGTFLVGAGLREQERTDAVKDTQGQLALATQELINFNSRVKREVDAARAAFIAVNGESAASLARFADIEANIWAQNEAKKTALTAAESAARVAFTQAETAKKNEILIESQNLVAELFEFSLVRVQDGVIKTGNILANLSNSVRDNLNNFLVNQINTIVNVVIQQFIATIVSAFTGMLLTGTFTFAGLSTAFQGFVVNILVGLGLVDKAVMKTGLTFNAMLGWIGAAIIAITALIALYRELFDAQEEVQQPQNVITTSGTSTGGAAISTDIVAAPRSIAEFQRQASATVFNFNQQFTFDQDFAVSGLDELRKVTADAILGNEPLIRRMVRNIFQQELQLQNVTTGSR